MWHHQWTSTFLEMKRSPLWHQPHMWVKLWIQDDFINFPKWKQEKFAPMFSTQKICVCLSSSMQMKNPQQLPDAALATEINKSEMKHQLSSHFTSEWVTFHHKGEQSFYPASEGNKRHAKMQMGTNLLLFWKRSSWFNRKCWRDYNGVWYKWCVHDHRLS